jgi:hypothetical protein
VSIAPSRCTPFSHPHEACASLNLYFLVLGSAGPPLSGCTAERILYEPRFSFGGVGLECPKSR